MSDVKHTPGPWSVNEDALTVEAGDITVCAVEPADKGAIFLVSHAVTEANARLIAAAPELLAALELVLTFMHPDHPAKQQARAAVAKATGSAS